MERLSRALIILIVLALCFAIQETRLLSIFSVFPNLLLIFCCVFLFLSLTPVDEVIVVALAAGALAALLFPWILSAILFAVTVGVLGFARRFLTGSRYIDFLLCIVLGTVIFTGAVALSYGTSIHLGTLFREVAYNSILGVAVYEAMRRICTRRVAARRIG